MTREELEQIGALIETKLTEGLRPMYKRLDGLEQEMQAGFQTLNKQLNQSINDNVGFSMKHGKELMRSKTAMKSG